MSTFTETSKKMGEWNLNLVNLWRLQFYELYFSADKQPSIISQWRTKSNHMISLLTNAGITFHNENTEEEIENWCEEEAIGEKVVEADHPGSWRKLQEKMLSKWNKVELFSQIYKAI
jgi:hypothetical protein